MNKFITIVGFDAHKDSIEICTADAAGKQEVRQYGKIGGDMASLDKAVRKLQSTGAELHFVRGYAAPAWLSVSRQKVLDPGSYALALGYHAAPSGTADRAPGTIRA